MMPLNYLQRYQVTAITLLCATIGGRTRGLLLFRQALFRLSYSGVFNFLELPVRLELTTSNLQDLRSTR